ncbi:hypothetical protein KS4_27610 [Poriferisphaera corsica]|uniref:Uncharacterized protein n=1 Tax=Poriferisphaera corsica TaxID=2528020 RepID=A0A517YWV4_9BACT|nr:hypothetical protein KS4_27610 [Poriferisphaera corsica]
MDIGSGSVKKENARQSPPGCRAFKRYWDAGILERIGSGSIVFHLRDRVWRLVG